MDIRKFVWVVLFLFVWLPTLQGAIVYQDFEPDNGTPAPYGSAKDAGAEYGWGFNGAAVGLNDEKDPVHAGLKSWKMNIPAGEHVHAGSAVPAQIQTYMVDFVPECHDRLTFWIWADPSMAGDHTAMVKFFDQGKYKQDGIGIWTLDTARYQQWTKLSILFSQLPADFNFHRVDKIEFFNFWDGTYYYDDIEVHSSAPAGSDVECLKKEQYLSCLEPLGAQGFSGNAFARTVKDGSHPSVRILGHPPQEEALCQSVFSLQSDHVLDSALIRAQNRAEGLALMEQHESF